MTQKQSTQRIRMYDPSTYRSVEQKVMGALEPVGKGMVEFGFNTIKFAYGFISAPLRVPTLVRKAYNDQVLIHKFDRETATPLKFLGSLGGGVGGLIADAYLLDYVVEKAVEGNYTPLITWAAANLASGLYELGRLKTSRKEHLGLIKYWEWQQKKAKKKKTKSKSGHGIETEIKR